MRLAVASSASSIPNAEIDYGASAPCIVSKLRASNTEIDARVNSWSTDNGDATSFHLRFIRLRERRIRLGARDSSRDP